jgi:hypothetical protein
MAESDWAQVAQIARAAVASRPTVAPREERLEATAQFVKLQPGLYTIELLPAPPTRLACGMVLPCMSVEPLPLAGHEGFVATLSPTRLLVPRTHPAFLRVTAACNVLLTFYKLAGMPPAEVQLRQIGPASLLAPEGEVGLPTLPLVLSVWGSGADPVVASGGLWAAAGEGAIEGFSLRMDGEMAAGAVQYQAILGPDWATPWLSDGAFCGTRRLALPLQGVRLRLGPSMRGHTAQVWGRFGKAGEIGPFGEGAACVMAGEALVGLRVTISAP